MVETIQESQSTKGSLETYRRYFANNFADLAHLHEWDPQDILLMMLGANRLVVITSLAEDEIMPLPIDENLQSLLDNIYVDSKVVPNKLSFSPYHLKLYVQTTSELNLGYRNRISVIDGGRFLNEIVLNMDNLSVNIHEFEKPKPTIAGYLSAEDVISVCDLLQAVSKRPGTYIEIFQDRYSF